MTFQPQYLKTKLTTKFSMTFIVSILLCSLSLSNAKSSEKTLESLKTKLLEDSTFLSKLREKITPPIDNHDIQKIVRDYLLTHPEIMIEMQLILQEKLEEQSAQDAKKQASVIKSLKKEIFQSPHDAVLGNPNGKRVLVDFFDYNCGYCKISYPYIENLIKEYPDLRVIIKDLPVLGSDSMAAHVVAYAFRKQFPEKYPQFYKELLTHRNRANEIKAIKIAISLGADEKKLRDAIKDTRIKNAFKKNIQIATTLNIMGTPSYIIGNKLLIGAVSEETLKEAIENMQ
ncbi:DsbA family protein [Bartonella senegalensis]|uniref:DsbA family protein n=1 Tax=Bartonella senegalensis TaxID=1468418 RepID=UPI0003003697|nr:DsbA family protein [Bartonella senegalensis]